VQNNNIEINDFFYKRVDTPYGKTWEEWAEDWWRYVMSIPKSQSPGLDSDGSRFDLISNTNENVLFFVGTYGGSAERYCQIRSNKAIFGPIMNYVSSFAENPKIISEDELKNHVRKDADDFKNMEFVLNGRKLQNIEYYRIDSDVFELFCVNDNAFNIPSGVTKAVCSGYYFFLKPLSRGFYDIRVQGSCSLGETNVDAIWHLSVI
jgi:hypothetical protein